jgi:trans-aconitate 2-methyltransferase
MTQSTWEGSYYATHSDMQYGMAIKSLNRIAISPKADILDIGCGDGKITKHIAELAPEGKVVGLDGSSSMIETAQSYAGKNLQFMQGDALALPFKDKFDLIVSFNCLHWVNPIQTALKGIKEALASGGRVLILIAPKQTKHPLHRIIFQVAGSAPWRSFFDLEQAILGLYTFAEWGSLIEAAGLRLEKMELMDVALDYIDKNAFAGWLGGWVPFGSIPPERRKEYFDALADAYTGAVPCERDGKVHLYLDELLIVASKL